MTNKPMATSGASIPALIKDATSYARGAKAANTRTAYRADWVQFCAWCDRQGLQSLPAAPSTVALYLTDRARNGSKVSSLNRYLCSISQAHKAKGLDSPRGAAEVRTVMQGIKRAHGTAQKHKHAITVDMLRAMVQATPATTREGVRNRALILLGFAGALRRSEIVGLDVDDIDISSDGLVLALRQSKTDPERRGRKVAIPFGHSPELCPVTAVTRLLATIPTGPLFINARGNRMTGKTLYKVIKQLCQKIGANPDSFSPHSLRAGFATAAAKLGKEERDIMRHTGHKSVTVLRRYINDGTLFTDHPADGIL